MNKRVGAAGEVHVVCINKELALGGNEEEERNEEGA